MKIIDHGPVRKVIHEPGNMTRYVGYACRNPTKSSEWIVSVPEMGFGGCYIFEEGCCPSVGYIIEKIPRRYKADLGETDASEIAKVIAMLVPRATAYVTTDDTGHPLEPGVTVIYNPHKT